MHALGFPLQLLVFLAPALSGCVPLLRCLDACVHGWGGSRLAVAPVDAFGACQESAAEMHRCCCPPCSLSAAALCFCMWQLAPVRSKEQAKTDCHHFAALVGKIVCRT